MCVHPYHGNIFFLFGIVWLVPAHKLDLCGNSVVKFSQPSQTHSISLGRCDIELLLYPAMCICGLYMRLKLFGALGKCKLNGYENIEWSHGACVLCKKKRFSGKYFCKLLASKYHVNCTQLFGTDISKLFCNSLFYTISYTLFSQSISLPSFCIVLHCDQSLSRVLKPRYFSPNKTTQNPMVIRPYFYKLAE